MNYDQNRNRKTMKYSIIIAVMIVFAALGQRSLSVNSNLIQAETKAETIQSAGSWTLTSISIDNAGTSTWVNTESTYDWCTGSGIEGDPYLIENVTITPSSGSGITIKNSRGVFFKIQNCTSGTTTTAAGYGGIGIYNSDFGELIENNCSEGAGSGIAFENSDNITIQDNFLSYNEFHGIFFDGSPDSCDENTISGNTMINNSILGIYLNYNNSLNIIEGNLIDGLGSQDNGIDFSNYGDYNTIIDNNIQNLNGLAINFGYMGSLNGHNYNLVQDNTILGGSKGIYFETDGIGNEIIGNSLTELTSSGVWVAGEDVLLQATLVQNNDFSECKTGIVADRYTEDTLITGNTINGTSTGTGINLYTWSRNNIVKENIINYNKRGIMLQNSNETHPIINNTINYNSEYGIYGYACKDQSILDNVLRYNNKSGIHFFFSENNVVAGNIISESIQDGLSLFLSNETYISGNIITMNQNNGIFSNKSNANHIVGNMIYDNGGTGISLESSNDSVVHDNILGGNLVCIEEVNCVGTIEYDNLCIQIGDGDPNDNETLSMSSLLDALTDTEGIVIGGTGLGIGAIIAALVAGGKKKPKKK